MYGRRSHVVKLRCECTSVECMSRDIHKDRYKEVRKCVGESKMHGSLQKNVNISFCVSEIQDRHVERVTSFQEVYTQIYIGDTVPAYLRLVEVSLYI